MKYVKTTIFLIFILLFCFTLTPVAHAEESSEVYSDFFGSLPDKIKDTLPEKVNGSDPEADTKRLTSWDFLLSALGGGVSSGFRRILPTFCAILGLILISSVINTVTSSLEPKTSKVLGITSNAAMAVAFVSLQIKTILSVGEYLSDLLTLVNTMTPVVAVLYASGGNVAGASVSSAAMNVFMAFSENVLVKTAVPISGVCLCLITVSALSPELSLERFILLIKSTYSKTLTFLMSIFCAILGIQTAIAAGSDSVSLRAVKFVTGSSIPIVGGSVNESMRMLAGSIGLLRKCFGVTGIIVIALLTLPTITMLLLSRFAVSLAAAAADLLHCPAERKLLDGISGVYGILIAVVSACSLMFVFLLTLLASSAVALTGATV